MREGKGFAIGPAAAEHRWSLTLPTPKAAEETCALGGNQVPGQALKCLGGTEERPLFFLLLLFLPAMVSLDFMRQVVSHLRQNLITALWAYKPPKKGQPGYLSVC